MNHPYIQKSYGFYKEKHNNDQSYCCLKLKPFKQDMFQYVRESFPKLIPVKQIRRWFKCVALALEYLHVEKDAVHFDIKPENIGI
mmetsp:Transcript_34933/g.48743  ORF Transcript_34933/g.48743 Transcript_34933/m.48743 type:complete len:85 (+) Transcript_34933:109-363(+)